MSMKYSNGSVSSSSSYWGRAAGGPNNHNNSTNNGHSNNNNNNNDNNNVNNPSVLWTLKCTDLPQFDALQAQADLFRSDDKLHLKNLCNDSARCAGLTSIHYSTTTSTPPSSSSSSSNNNALFQEETKNNDHNTLLLQQQQLVHRRIILDYSRQRVVGETMELLFDLADAVGLTDRRESLRQGHAINVTTGTNGQPVLHFLLRKPESSPFSSDTTTATTTTTTTGGSASMLLPNQLRQIVAVRRHIAEFAQRVRTGSYASIHNQMPFRNTLVVCSSRGGYQSGPECVVAALEQEAIASAASQGRTLRFVASSDPTQIARATHDLNAAETLVVIIWLESSSSSTSTSTSTTTTAAQTETLLNAKAIQRWLVQSLRTENNNLSEKDILAQHVVAVACANKSATCQQLFGIRKEHLFPIWEWVNPRYSLCSAAGLLPLSLHFSSPVMDQLLDGAHDMDEHFFQSPLRDNIPVLLGLLGVWNSTFLGYSSRVILPYADGLRLLPAHVQQVDMESNGKRVALDGTPLLHRSGEIDVTTAPYIQQQSLLQLLHQGRAIPADFIGFMQNQAPLPPPIVAESDGDDSPSLPPVVDRESVVSNHDELMCQFFAEPDALAYGKTLVELIQEGTPEPLREHMVVTGNRPSSSLLLTKLDAFSVGQLLALYEHRTAVQGFLWGLNSFDQFGIELGQVLAKRVRSQLSSSRKTGASVQGFNSSTSFLLEHYLAHGKKHKGSS